MRFPQVAFFFACLCAAVVPCAGEEARKKEAAAEHGWFTVGGELRGRFEAPTALKFDTGKDDACSLSRARLSFTVRPGRGVTLFAEVQDARAPAGNCGWVGRNSRPATSAWWLPTTSGIHWAAVGTEPASPTGAAA